MNILLLEDEASKREQIIAAVREVVPDAVIECVGNWYDYTRQIV